MIKNNLTASRWKDNRNSLLLYIIKYIQPTINLIMLSVFYLANILSTRTSLTFTKKLWKKSIPTGRYLIPFCSFWSVNRREALFVTLTLINNIFKPSYHKARYFLIQILVRPDNGNRTNESTIHFIWTPCKAAVW